MHVYNIVIISLHNYGTDVEFYNNIILNPYVIRWFRCITVIIIIPDGWTAIIAAEKLYIYRPPFRRQPNRSIMHTPNTRSAYPIYIYIYNIILLCLCRTIRVWFLIMRAYTILCVHISPLKMPPLVRGYIRAASDANIVIITAACDKTR